MRIAATLRYVHLNIFIRSIKLSFFLCLSCKRKFLTSALLHWLLVSANNADVCLLSLNVS